MGGLYASLAHWKVTEDIGTVVMPTGTGKTETMLSLLMQERPERLLIIVPTSALRDQIAEKFLTLGILREFGIVKPSAQFPLVGRLEHLLNTKTQAKEYLECCNVVVATMSVISRSTDQVQNTIADECSHLFIDEAHHAPADTWAWFRQHFLAFDKPVLQFTATPFRSDGKHVGGKIIFNYPLRKAQEEEYFKPISFHPLWEYDPHRADQAIAESAVDQLKEDLEAGYDHVVMARANTITRAKTIHAIYQRLAPEYEPILVHSQQSASKQVTLLKSLRDRNSRIISCVDMLGEGFDLPQLKIAALHDVHKSLSVTIQFIGRFARTASGIGEATVIANCADAKVEEALEDLYSKEANWNLILRRLSGEETGRQERLSEFLEEFTNLPEGVPLQNIRPKMSAVFYKTKCGDWKPNDIFNVVKEERFFAKPSVNAYHKVTVFVTQERSPISWGESKVIEDVVHDLYILHWSKEQEVLCINSTNNRSLHRKLADAVGGKGTQIIRGEDVYRTLHGINRYILTNLGLLGSYSRAVRFSMYVGPDIKEGLTAASLTGRSKTNLFAHGFEGGDRVSIGCSYKGRIWSHKVAKDISEWVDWCHHISAKLLNDSISVDEILEHVIIPERIEKRPNFVPIAVEWSEYFFMRNEDTTFIEIGEQEVPFYEAEMLVTEFCDSGPLRFSVHAGSESVEYEVVFYKGNVTYRSIGIDEAYINASQRRQKLSEWFQEEPPIIRFANNGFLVYDLWHEPREADVRELYKRECIEAWDWSGIHLHQESKMKAIKDPPRLIERPDSIQSRVIERLLQPGIEPEYDIIFDDDDTGEVADIVAIKISGDRLLVHLFHCKYSRSIEPGQRVADLYEVCGQAQRSVCWKGAIDRLLKHLVLREYKRQQKYNKSRFEKGDLDKINMMAQRARYLEPAFKVFIVQPGITKSNVTNDQLDLLAATELYLQETYAVDLEVIASL
jgi:hypothetical protein